MTWIAENVAAIKERMASACIRAGRDPGQVRLIAVTKTVPLGLIREGVQAGLSILGENYAQEARRKVDALTDMQVSWHFIGHLQSNKARVAVECCDWIHTLDRTSLAKEIDRQARKRGIRVPVLIQVNIGDESSKSGVSPEALHSLFQEILPLEGLAVRGLMTLPPYLDDPEEARPYFRRMRELLEHLREESSFPDELTELSMGMSHDFEVAIEEGATLVRIGTALFGKRLNR